MADDRVETIERFVRAGDGLRLFVRDHRPRDAAPRAPLVCLPGLTRDGRDFEALARHFTRHEQSSRRVVTIDFRGRGRSDHDADAANYNVLRETQDVIEALAALGIDHAVLIGTSRGGLVTMQLAATRPELVAGAVLNDIGPVLEISGLRKIGAALAATRAPSDWADAAHRLRSVYGADFPHVDEAGWAAMAARTYVERDGRPAAPYDERLATPLRDLPEDVSLPAMWPQFDALAASGPVLVLRGANSALLSQATVGAMLGRRHGVRALTVPDVGHPAPLATPAEFAAIETLLDEVDRPA
ncbi:alpha/beta fold hydrolase [Lutibaculum baratangense]|uniref:Putative hydrolase n=1 Tax=Lutibaculum baratangense AMV1 TaxID=631454 RepID=V4RIX4_9HYPH|nr:alpha/beta hydrolase [Lutibaculum baratangense]ESR23225.1 putative hydrolase [Lutibaculum baratangense AMV1]